MTARFLFAAAAAAALALPAAAAPTVTSTIDLRSLRMSFVDTDPDDGVAAVMQADTGWRSAWACEGPVRPEGCNFAGTAASSTVDPMGTAEDRHTVPGAWTGVAVAAPDVLTSSFAGSGTTGLTGINTALSQGLRLDGTGRFTVEVDYTLSAAGLEGGAFREMYAWAGIIFFVDGGPQQVEQWLTAPASGAASRSGTLSFSQEVVDGGWASTFVHTHVHTLSPIAAPVPEPATWALMLAGLAGVGGSVARRRRG